MIKKFESLSLKNQLLIYTFSMMFFCISDLINQYDLISVILSSVLTTGCLFIWLIYFANIKRKVNWEIFKIEEFANYLVQFEKEKEIEKNQILKTICLN